MISNHRRRTTIGCLIAFLCITWTPRAATAQTADQWRSDLTYLMSAMKSVHPSPFHRVPESEFDAAAERLSRQIDKLTPQQIAVRMESIAALLNDGHSRVQFRAPVFKNDKVFGARIDRFADGIFVTAASPELSSIVGKKVLRIGSMSAAAAWDSVMTFASGDNVFSRMSNVPRMLASPEVLSAIGISSADALTLVVSDAKGERKVVVTAQSGEFRPQWTTSRIQQLSPGVLPISELHRNEAYWFTQRGSMVYAQINQVQNSNDTVDVGPTRRVISLPDFAERFIAFADSVSADRVVIDLRYNDGGDNYLARPFVRSIVEHPRINRRGHLFVITGRDTYSAAMNFTSMLEDRTRAIFVGEAPGGSPSHYGDATQFTMPASKLAFYVSTLHWDTGVFPNDLREVMEPDLPAAPLFADAARGVDAALEKVMNYKEGDRLADRLLSAYKTTGLDATLADYDRERRSVALPDPWRSDVQQLLEFADDVISIAKTRAAIFGAYSAVTDRYPDSHLAWASNARVHGFIADWPAAAASLARAKELRPQNDFIRRSYEAAKRR